MKNYNNIKLFIQLEDFTKNEEIKDIRYTCAGVINEQGQLSGIVYGYEGGGEYSEQLILNGNFIPNYDEDLDEHLEFDEQITYLEDLTEKGFYDKCYNAIEDMMSYDKDTCNYKLKTESNYKFGFFDNGDKVYSEFPDQVTPPDYGNTYWKNNDTGLYTIKELDTLCAA
jgi:hypothetical protein